MPRVIADEQDRLEMPKRRRSGADRLAVRACMRSAAVGLLGLTILYGLAAGGHLEDPRNPLYGLPGKLAGHFGYAAQHIHISGLEHQTPEMVLKAIGVTPDGPLLGFSSQRAKKLLEHLDWVESAKLRRVHPNGLDIEIVERTPFAIWQLGGTRYVIDKTGVAMSSLDPDSFTDLLVVTGDGAQEKPWDLVNHIEGHTVLKSHLRAAARVGMRRWTLYLDNGLRIALAEDDIAGSLDRAAALIDQENVLDRGVALIDLRMPGQVVMELMPRDKPEQGS
jgi:cell division protein FtsQ